MDIVIISFAAFLTAILTFFTGFGLGTILTPVFMLFFPVEVSIALTGVVHFINNIFKLILVGKKANKEVIFRFGIPAIIAAVAGSLILLNITKLDPLFSYQLNDKVIEVYPVKFIIALLLIIFALLELVPILNKFHFSKKHMPVGGILSGFFGGLSGNQGALRTAFLIRAGLTKEVFIATTVVISCLVDFTRLSIYATNFSKYISTENIPLLISATLSAIAGAYFGNRLLKKITLKSLQKIVAVFLILISIGLASGLI